MKLMVHVSGPLRWNAIAPTDDTITVMLRIEKSILSEKYDLPVLSRVKGKFVDALDSRLVPVFDRAVDACIGDLLMYNFEGKKK